MSILAPSEVKANIELYECIDLMKYLEKVSPFGFNKLARNGGDLLEELGTPYLPYNRDENVHGLLHLDMFFSHAPSTKTTHHSTDTCAQEACSMISHRLHPPSRKT
jgi:hypothetical protein